MTGWLTFEPSLAWPALGALATVLILVALAAIASRAPGAIIRLAGFLLILAVLANPAWRARTTSPLPDVALVLLDQSGSMAINNRPAMAARALAALQASAGGTHLDIVRVAPAPTGGTDLAPALATGLAAIQPSQLAGVIAITDGEVAPLPGLPHAPFTALLAAAGEETDRELRLMDQPAYGLVGQNATLRFTVLDHGADDAGATATVTIAEDGVPVASTQAVIGASATVSLPIRHAGPIVVTAAVTPLPDEVSRLNDTAAFTLTGIRKRLKVLLISGNPDQGERAWRVLLKSDPAVELIHFTILRLPGEQIDAAPQDLALVPFPIRELFEADINKFDLIILDDFNARGLLQPAYLINIANFVTKGGALFAEVGPEFASADSLAISPLGPILPATPVEPGIVTQTFAPEVTSLGARDPVTAPFADATLAPWFRMESASVTSGDILMTGADNLPLLVLGPEGQGRVGMLLSDQLWLWTRSGHDGPALPLLRRTVHWLLREPALEAESLSITLAPDNLTVTRQTLKSGNPGDITITAPDGTLARIPFHAAQPGQFTATLAIPPDATGIWRAANNGETAYAARTPENTAEYENLAATAAILRPRANDIIWLGQTPAPNLQPLLRPRHAVQVTGERLVPLLPPVPTLLLAFAMIALAWWREGKAR